MMSNWMRIERALHEKMTYELIEDIDGEKIYTVRGSRGIDYTVNIGEDPRCTCPDYVLRGGRCKHQILVLIKDLNYAITDPILNSSSTFDDNLKYESNALKECAICLDDIILNAKIWKCGICSNIIHTECVKKWSAICERHNMRKSCPLCRNKL